MEYVSAQAEFGIVEALFGELGEGDCSVCLYTR